MKSKYKAQVDHLRGQLALVEQTNAQLSNQVAALTEELSKLRCGTDGSKMYDEKVVIKQERRDSCDSDTTLDGSTCSAREGAAPPPSVDGKGSDPPHKKPVPTT